MLLTISYQTYGFPGEVQPEPSSDSISTSYSSPTYAVGQRSNCAFARRFGAGTVIALEVRGRSPGNGDRRERAYKGESELQAHGAK